MSKRLVSDKLIEQFAVLFDKSVDYTRACFKFHDITEIPAFRYAGDEFGDFYSDMSAVVFDERIEGKPDPVSGKAFYPAMSMTRQEFTDELDINNIMARYISSDFDPSSLPVSVKKPLYGDFTAAPESYHAAISFITDTQRSFMTLDAELRARFDNDPQKFIDFVSDPLNQDEIISLGLATRVTPSVMESIHNGVKEGVLAAEAAKSSVRASKAPKNVPEGGIGVAED